MADVTDASGVFDLELHEEENPRDSDDDRIELDDVSTLFVNLSNFNTTFHLSITLKKYFIYKKRTFSYSI